MSSFNIEVIDVDYQDVPKKNGQGTYGVLTVTHKTSDGKVEAKKIFDFSAPKDTFARLRQAVKGEGFSITREKNANGYWDWTGADRQDMAVTPKAAAAPSPKSNYETSEERAAKQVYIIKQSSLERAVALMIHNFPQETIKPSDVISMADVFVNYVMDKRVEDMEDDIPY
jgi:hypothetical protein